MGTSRGLPGKRSFDESFLGCTLPLDEQDPFWYHTSGLHPYDSASEKEEEEEEEKKEQSS